MNIQEHTVLVIATDTNNKAWQELFMICQKWTGIRMLYERAAANNNIISTRNIQIGHI